MSMRSHLLAAAAVLAIGCSACRVVGEDTRTKLVAVEEGMTEQQVLRLLGPPTKTGKPSSLCAHAQDSVRELLYQTRAVWFGGLLTGPAFDDSVVCLDAASKVVGTGVIDY